MSTLFVTRQYSRKSIFRFSPDRAEYSNSALTVLMIFPALLFISEATFTSVCRRASW